MKTNIFILLLLITLTSCGCLFHHKPKVVATAELSPLRFSRIVQKERLARGGNIVLSPFTAGEGVIADDALDHVSLEILRGIADVLIARGKPFHVLGSSDERKTDFVLSGQVNIMKRKGHILFLQVSGKVLDDDNEQTLAVFSQKVKSRQGTDQFTMMGYRTGVEIGKFLLSVSE